VRSRSVSLSRTALLVALLLAAVALGGCGGAQGFGDKVDQARERAAEVRQRIEERVERARRRFDEFLARLEQAVPRAQTTSPRVQPGGRTSPTTIDAFLTDVLRSVDAYWTRTFRASDLPAPRVGYSWIPPGRVELTGCGEPAGDSAAFYCPSDDVIYVAQRFAADLFRGVADNLPGERAGFGHAAGGFGVAYVVAHEYSHNIQAELGLFRLARANSTKAFELQADCMAGAWGSAVYAEGRVGRRDIRQAIDTAMAVGDFDVSSANHHGTPLERRDAWLTGFDSADPSACRRFLPA
jgi:uncharacterized protein